MAPNEALQYISQCLSDYGRTLPPSAAMPFQQVAQQAVDALAPLVNPPPKDDALAPLVNPPPKEPAEVPHPLRAVGNDAE